MITHINHEQIEALAYAIGFVLILVALACIATKK